jgi:hypothetical protein
MTPDPRKIAISEHQRWMGYLQPDGLVVSPLALVDAQVQLDTGSYTVAQERFLDALTPDPESGALGIPNFAFFARNFLCWRDELLSIFSVSAEVPPGLKASTGEHGELLEPSAAYKFFKPADPARPYLLLVKQLPLGTLLDQLPDAKQEKGWVATPHQKFERMLRETGVHLGVLCNGSHVRITYAPKGENSGSLTFPVAFMTETSGRILPAALDLLLSHRRLNSVPEPLRLPALLRKSRDYQAHVSTALSHQVLEALFEMARGFQTADERTKGTLLAEVWQKDPQQIYGGLITTLLRLVFLLYAEDRGLMPGSELYQRGYSVQGLFDQLRTDAERFPDHMDDRFAAWPRLLALFRAVHGGCRHREMTLPARQGHLFDPDRFPFLEGRNQNPESRSQTGEAADSSCSLLTDHSALPLLSDGTLHRVLYLLLYLDGERLSYRTLDVEQIGSVYETIMGFAVEKAPGRMIALKPKKAHGAPVHISLDALLAAKPADREKIVLEQADTKLPDAAAKALKAAVFEIDLLAALEKRIDRRATPHPVATNSIILQPTDERRRSGSHYTPRSFTEPIVRKTLEPILDRLGRHPQPDAILDLKIADIAVGSAAFLVETCRQLADELVSSWHFHKCLPVIPPDEDELLFARRLVAQRCLYGVDRNPMAVDLAKLSLWLATMAKDHPFTFLDHAIKCGDSLVGLTNRQIAAFHWDPAQAAQRVMGQDQMEKLIETVTARRKEIIADPEDTEYAILRKLARLAEADAAAQKIKTTGDLAVAAFFAGSKPKERQQLRDEFLERHLALQVGQNVQENLPWQTRTFHQLRSGEHPILPFHWEIEFPEVFSRENPGFDGIVGNPPYLGSVGLSTANAPHYTDHLRTRHKGSGGKADLAAFFLREAFDLLRPQGTVGLVTTQSICQGDTRASGLKIILGSDGQIYSAIKRRKWPGAASVIVSIIHLAKSPKSIEPHLNGRRVSRISAFLVEGNQDDVQPLQRSEPMAGLGNKPNGKYFCFSEKDAHLPLALKDELLADEPMLKSVLHPYLGGSEMNGMVESFDDRWIADLTDTPESQLSDFTSLLQAMETKLPPKPRENWWRFEHYAAELRDAVRKNALDRILCIAESSDTFAFRFLPASYCISNTIIGFSSASYRHFALLQSVAHETWVRGVSSSLKDDPRYVPEICYKFFPFPSDWEENAALEEAGKTYYEFRAELMVRNDEGLTKTYNRFHDPDERSPDILRLRELHAAMDRAVLDAYGWSDIPTDCQFLLDYEEDEDEEVETTGKKRKKKKPWRYRWPDEVRDEVLARLLALNAERAAQEKLAGAGMKTAKKTAAKKVTKKRTAAVPMPFEPVLFGLQDRPWELAIDRISVTIPDRSRQAAESSLTYYRLLIPALVQEAGGSLPLNLLFTAVESLEDRERVVDAVDGPGAADKKRWLSRFNETLDPAAFGSALRSLAVDGKRIRIVGSSIDSLEVRNQLTEPITLDWILADASMTLKATRKLGSEALVTPPAEITEELIRHARSA